MIRNRRQATALPEIRDGHECQVLTHRNAGTPSTDSVGLEQKPVNPQDLIALKRDGKEFAAAEIRLVVDGIASGSFSDAQVAALSMAIFLKGMTFDERLELTLSMRDSGTVFAWDLDGPVLDKHSTGGIGDCVSLVLAPALAACGAFVPMISARGLGHTGGTVDKLEAIPGYQTNIGPEMFRSVVSRVGCAVVGQTGEIAPADGRIFGIRNETATVPSIDLITSSILSKKLAGGIEGLVLDVKVGSGAFCRDSREAEALAGELVRVARRAECPTVAMLTSMDQPLAPNAGNALEVRSTLDVLTGSMNGVSRLQRLTERLGGELLAISSIAGSVSDGENRIRCSIASGRAAEIFGRMVCELGGPADMLERTRDRLGRSPVRLPVPAPESGHVGSIDCRRLGMVVVELGGGRRRAGDRIDHRVGLEEICETGSRVEKGDPLVWIHAKTRDDIDRLLPDVEGAFAIEQDRQSTERLIRGRVAE